MACALASGCVWWIGDQADMHASAVGFEHQSEEITERVARRLALYGACLSGAQGLFAASRTVESDEWDAYFAAQSLERMPGLLDCTYSPRETPERLATLPARLRAHNVPQEFLEALSKRTYDPGAREYFPIIYAFPNDVRIAGLDLGSIPESAKTIAIVRDSGAMRLSWPLTLVRDPEPRPAYRLVAPIYDHGQPAAGANDTRPLIGIVSATFRTRDLFATVCDGIADIEVEVVDSDLAGRDLVLFDRFADRTPRDAGQPAWHRRLTHLPVAGRDWRMHFASTPAFERASGHTRGLWCAALSLLGSTLLLLQLGTMLASRRRAYTRAEGMASSLRKSEAEVSKLALVASKTANGVVITDANGAIDWVNDGFLRLTGYSFDEIRGRKPGSFLQGPETDPAQVSMMRARMRANKAFTAELINYRKDGTPYWVVIEVQPVFDARGSLVNYLAIETDITERVRSYSNLRTAYAETESLLSSISAVLVSVLEDERIVRWNQAAEAAFSRRSDEVLGLALSECGVAWDLPEIRSLLRTCRDQDATFQARDVRYKRPDGSDGVIEMGCAITRNERGDRQLTLVGLDVTSRRVLQSHLNHAMKLESIGQLAAGVAHEINTPTQFVGDNLRFLQDGFASFLKAVSAQDRALDAARSGTCTDDILAATAKEVADADLPYLAAEVPKAVQQSLDGVKRIADIVGALKAFSHRDEGQHTPVDLGKALLSTLMVARNEYKYVADVVTDFSPELPPVPCLAGEINQVFLNLIVNAAHAISDAVRGSERRGTITITTARRGDWVEVRISDTGAGIPVEIRERIFDPFFTTKEVGRGSGQGLYIARDIIVAKHAGALTFETEIGVGTTFIIRLPLERIVGEEAKRHSSLHLVLQAPLPVGDGSSVNAPP